MLRFPQKTIRGFSEDMENAPGVKVSQTREMRVDRIGDIHKQLVRQAFKTGDVNYLITLIPLTKDIIANFKSLREEIGGWDLEKIEQVLERIG